MFLGLVKWFDREKGFGMVESPEKGTFFLHINSILSKSEKVLKETAVLFEIKTDLKKNRNNAVNCRLIEDTDDWKNLMAYLDKDDKIIIEKEVKGRSRLGNPFVRKENTASSILDISARQIFKEKDEDELFAMIINYFNEFLNKKLFAAYCEFIEKSIYRNTISSKADLLKNKIINYFQNKSDDEIIFYAWKHKALRYVGYSDVKIESSYSDDDIYGIFSYTTYMDHEIPYSILEKFSDSIEIQDIKRILKFNYGLEFCEKFITRKFENLNNFT